jgi:hypothetical protein
MACKKVALRYNPKVKTRHNTLKKCIHGLMKKTGKVYIMSDAKICIIIYPEGERVL